MAVEIELKLALAPEHLNQLKRHRLLKQISTGRAVTQKLYSVYYDTPDLALRNHAMALRLRRVGKQWLQTLKGGGGVQAGLHQRHEWETPVAGEALDLDALKACGGALPAGVSNRLQPAFVTDFARSVRLLNYEGAEIELGLDSGEIRAGNNTRPISELELELKSGDPQQLFKLALALLDVVPLSVENTSKAEYGYRLFSGEQPQSRKVNWPAVASSQDVISALQNAIAACLAQIQANVPGVIENLDEEYLHQVRVGLRRLRVALAVTAEFCGDEELDGLRRALKALDRAFSRLREWDVFVTQTLAGVGAQIQESRGWRGLQAAAEAERARQRAAVVRTLQGQDFQRLLLRLGAWMYGNYWRDAAREKHVGLAKFSARILNRRSKEVSKRGAGLGAADAARLHLLRIACKKLRYSAEMFAALYAPARSKPYLAAVSHLQDTLGRLHDIAVARRLLDELQGTGLREAAGAVRDALTAEHAQEMALLKKAWKKFERQDTFWD